MAKKGAERVVQLCRKCGHRHYNNFGKPCPPPSPVLMRQVPEGYRVLKELGERGLRGAPRPVAEVVYLHPLKRGGSLNEPPEAA